MIFKGNHIFQCNYYTVQPAHWLACFSAGIEICSTLQRFFRINLYIRVQMPACIDLLQVVLNCFNTGGCAGKQFILILRY